ncbi:MAG TPA: RNA 2',3'-cyclic phosphodiesterase [Halomonas sp.]|nr:RNA 2',3'-cyclic phosphodiesterase [Halomonas sp.]
MRLFLALLPPAALKPALAGLADAAHLRCGGRRMADDSLHLTLAFLGEQNESMTARLAERVGAMRAPAGQWQLDRWGYFSRPGIVWVGSARPCAPLQALQAALWDALEALGIQGRPQAFLPHVTLLRRAKRPPGDELPAAPELQWRYRRLALVRSVASLEGSRYSVLARSSLP